MAKGLNKYVITWHKPVWVKGELKQPGEVVELDNVEISDMQQTFNGGDKIYRMITPYEGKEKKAAK